MLDYYSYYFVPTNLDRKVIDLWIKTNDRDSFLTARSLIKNEGLLVGGSSGAIMSAAIKLAKGLPENKRVVVLLPDGIRNYMTKFVSDYWMEYHGFVNPPEPSEKNRWWWNLPVSNIQLTKPVSLRKGATCKETMDILQKSMIHQTPILVENNKVQGIVTLIKILSDLTLGKVDDDDPVEKIMIMKFPKIESSATLGKLSRILENEHFAIVLNKDEFLGIARQTDLLSFIKTNHDC